MDVMGGYGCSEIGSLLARDRWKILIQAAGPRGHELAVCPSNSPPGLLAACCLREHADGAGKLATRSLEPCEGELGRGDMILEIRKQTGGWGGGEDGSVCFCGREKKTIRRHNVVSL